MMTHNSYNEKARELIKNRKLGNVNDICLHMEFSYGSTLAEAKTWRCAKQEELGGPIGDVASHCMYMAEFLLQSKIRSLACVYYPKIMKIKVEDGAYIKFEMENGLAGSLKVSFNEARGGLGGTLSNLGYEIYGDKAVLRGYGTMFQLSGYADEPVKVRLELDEFKKIRGITPGKIKNIYQGVIIEHAKSIKSGKLMDGVDAMHNLELVEAAHKSAKTNGKKLKVS
jgi:predicted dehydrogenase